MESEEEEKEFAVAEGAEEEDVEAGEGLRVADEDDDKPPRSSRSR